MKTIKETAEEFQKEFNLWDMELIGLDYGDYSLTDGKTHIVFEEDAVLICGDDGEGNPDYVCPIPFHNTRLAFDEIIGEYRQLLDE